ncbi:ankyrin-2 isoform X1 [Oreochromis niloticus]|uniref:ankyrin-2 isoform X1 n=1 Tax=Oreochromis niloticus TaxID=8128 RepID=UPI000DF19BBB|nr:ankyrin-2 isoform X1 [Oreochromis niloticus]
MSAVFTPDIYEERAETNKLEERESVATVEQFKDRVEKAGEINNRMNVSKLRGQQIDAIKDKFSLYGANALEEPVIKNTDIEKQSLSRSYTDVREITLFSPPTTETEKYLGQKSARTCGSQEDLVQDGFEQVIEKRADKKHPPDIKKPIRKKLRDRSRSGCSSSEGELERMSSEESLDGDAILKESSLLSTQVVEPPASPLVVETPIGSIKDRVKALQNKVEEEEVQKNTKVFTYDGKSSITTKKMEEAMPELPRVPKSPRSQTERLEETMSVKDLMKAFQTGEDPSKSKSGLFEHQSLQSSCISTLISESPGSETVHDIEQRPTQEPKSQIQTQKPTIFHQQSSVKKGDQTDIKDEPANLISCKESQFTSDSVYIEKMVKFSDTVQRDDESVSPLREVSNLSEKEGFSVKHLIKTFQTGQEDQKGKAGPHSTLILDSNDSEERETNEQSPTQEPESQSQSQRPTVFHSKSDADVHSVIKTDTDDQSQSLIKTEPQLISDSSLLRKTVTFADTVQYDAVSPQRDVPEFSEKQNVSVKELMKTFQSVKDPSKTKVELFEHKPVASSISTLISHLGDSAEIQSTEQSPTKQTNTQIQSQTLTNVHQQSDAKQYDQAELVDQPVTLIKEDSQIISDIPYGKSLTFVDTLQGDQLCRNEGPKMSHKDAMSVKELRKTFESQKDPLKSKVGALGSESGIVTTFQPQRDVKDLEAQTGLLQNPESSQQMSDISCFGETVKNAYGIQLDDGRVSSWSDDSELSRRIMQLEEPAIRKSISDDTQISPDRRPSEDFSADIKAELEESPKYQQFKQTASDVRHQLETPEEESFAQDSDTYFEEDISPKYLESHKHKGMDKFSETSVITTYHSSTGERDSSEGLSGLSNEIHSYSTKEDGMYVIPSEEDQIQVEIKTSSQADVIREKELMPTSVTETSLQEVYIDKKVHQQSYEHSAKPKEMAGMLSLLNTDLDQYLKDKPVKSEHAEEVVVQENFEQVIHTKIHQSSSADMEDDINDEETQIDVAEVKELTRCSISETSFQQTCIQKSLSLQQSTTEKQSTSEKNMSGLLSLLNNDLNQHLQERPMAVQSEPEEDLVHESYEEIVLSSHDLQDKLGGEENEVLQTNVTTEKGLTQTSVSETPFQETCTERNLKQQESASEKNMSGLISLLSSDLIQHLKEKPVTIQSKPQEELVSERFQQVILTRDNSEGKIEGESNEDLQTDVIGDREIPSSVVETPFQEVCIETKAHHQPSTSEKNMSGMLSLLSHDLGQHLQEKSMAMQSEPGEDLVCERWEQIIIKSNDLQVKIGEEPTEDPQTDEIRKKELTPTSVTETPFQEVCTDKKAHQQSYEQSAKPKEMAGMLSLLNTDLDQYLKDKPVKSEHTEEVVVQENFEQVIHTKIHQSSSADMEDEMNAQTDEQTQIDVAEVKEPTPCSISETQFRQTCIERNLEQPKSTSEKNMSGMVSHLSSDLVQHLNEKSVTIQSQPQEELVNERFQQVILTSDTSIDMIRGEPSEDLQTDVSGDRELTPSSMVETSFQEIYIERKAQRQPSSSEKNTSGMLSLLSHDLDQHLQEKSVPVQPEPEEHLVHERCEQIILSSNDLQDEIDGEANENLHTDVITEQELMPTLTTETPLLEVCLEKMVQYQQSYDPSTKPKEMSGMLSLLNSDLDQYLKDKPVKSEHTEEVVVQENFQQVIHTKMHQSSSADMEDEIGAQMHDQTQIGVDEVKELTPCSISETQFEETCIERNLEQPKSTSEKNMSGMVSHLSSDLVQHLSKMPVKIQCKPQEELVHERFQQVILTPDNLEGKIEGESNEELQTDVIGDRESALETSFQEVYIETKAQHQQSTSEKNTSGMLSLLSHDLDQHLQEKSVAVQPEPEEHLVHERCEQIILSSSDLQDKIDGEANENLDTDVIREQELMPTLASETPLQEVCLEKMVQYQQSYDPSTKPKEMSGMLSLLNSDLDQYLKDKPVKSEHTEEVVVQENFQQVIHTKMHQSSSADMEDEIGAQMHDQTQIGVDEVKELTPCSISETQFEETCIERNLEQPKSTSEKNMSGMVSHLSSDLVQHLSKMPVKIQCKPQEELVHERFQQVILTPDNLEGKTEGESNEELQTDVIGDRESALETSFQEIYIETKAHHQPSTSEKNTSGMLSLLSHDLDQHLQEKSVAVQPEPEEHLVHERCEQIILSSSDLQDKIDGEANENLHTDEIREQELMPTLASETPLQEVCLEKMVQYQQSYDPSTKPKEMSGMLSLLNSDLDQYLKDKPVKSEHTEEVVVQENFQQVIHTKMHQSSSADMEDEIGAQMHDQTQIDVAEVKELTPCSISETQFEETCIERNLEQPKSTSEKNMSGMVSHLSSDLVQHLSKMPVKIQCKPQEELVHERFQQVILTPDNLEGKIKGESNEELQTDVTGDRESALETPFQEVYTETKAHHQPSTSEKNTSGMLSLLSHDLDQHLQEKSVVVQSEPEEVVVNERCEQTTVKSNDLQVKIAEEENEELQTEVMGDREIPSSVVETPFQEICIERKAHHQPSTTGKNMSGMLSLLSHDLDQHLEEKSAVVEYEPEDELVHESYKQVIAIKDFKQETHALSPEHKLMSPADTIFDSLDITKKQPLESGWHTCSKEDEGLKSFSSEEIKTLTTEWMVDGKSYAHDYQSDHEDVSVAVSDPVLRTHLFQVPSSFNTLQRPADLENLNTVVFDDPANESCHRDSLEASPLVEDKSSQKSPDSIEPSPTKESPCPDSLEGSPTQSSNAEVKIPATTAVYEDYASQLRACFAYDKNIYSDECEHVERDNNLETTEIHSENIEDKYSESTKRVAHGESLHMFVRQDCFDTEERAVDGTNKQLTPEEEMFKMAAKIKTFEEMEQESKLRREKSFDAMVLSETNGQENGEVDLKSSPVSQSVPQDTIEKITEKYVTESIHTLTEAPNIAFNKKEEIQSHPKSTHSVDNSLCLTATPDEPDQECEYSVPHKDKDTIGGVVTDIPFSGSDEHHLNDDKEVGSPFTIGSASVSQPQTTVCTKEEEFVVECEGLCISEDRKTPDKTPGDEKTPDPFQFQEGKLFEMTRGGAIDMTRSFDEEREAHAFFHIGEHPVDEVVPEETEHSQSKSLTLQMSDYVSDVTHQETPNSYLTQGTSDKASSPNSETVIIATSGKSQLEKPLTKVESASSSSALDNKSLESLGLSYLDSTIADLQSDISTVAHSFYSDQSHDFSDSSPDDDDDDDDAEEEEDQRSVIEMAFSSGQPSMPGYNQDSPAPLTKPATAVKGDGHYKKAKKDTQISQVQGEEEKRSTLARRTRSEASDINKSSIKDSRSYSDGSQPTNTTDLSPSKLTVMTQEKALPHMISTCSSPRKDSQLSKTIETSVRLSLDTDDISSGSHKSPDSVIFTYDIPASHSSGSDGSRVEPTEHVSCDTEDVFESRPAWNETVETQMQRIIDDQTSECTAVDWQEDADRKEETLAIISDLLGFSWTELARELEFSEDDIQLVRTENPNSLQEQSHALLQRWVEREGKHATEDCLIKRLTKINRMDIVHLIETQMNKSVQEQTSRTYAEIEKTLDHSEVSVALSSVQEDADSPRVVRKVESDRRPPPAVSEEDLSVASLLDIPSWAEPVGQIHSESMHGDLLEELEIPHELNPNLWTSEDVITRESSQDNLDEQSDEMPDLPAQSVSEERYKDENGHIVVKKVTRKIIRKCVSADGAEHEEMTLEGAPQGFVPAAEGDGYSKVVKRTVVKSEGDHTEVTFTEREHSSSLRQETADERKISHTERTTVVEGERTVTHHGDQSLTSDLPTAQDDFKEGPSA